MRPDFFRILRRETTTILVVGIVISLIFVPLGYYFSQWLWLGLLLIPVGLFVVIFGTYRLLKLGACCPAKVLSLDPPRLAIFSDMSMRPDAAHPAIIVKEFSPHGISGPLNVGDRLAVAAFYEAGDEKRPEERWKSLCVIEPIRAFTSDPQVIQRTLASIEEDEWKQLDSGAHRAQPPYDEQVYFLEAGQKDGGRGVTEGRVFLAASDDPEMKKV